MVDLSTQHTVGILGEEFILLKAKVGVHFICKGRVWKIEKIADDMKVYVTPVDDPLAAIPGWDGELLPVPCQLAQRTGALRREISEMLDRSEPNEVVKALANSVPAERNARTAIVEEIFEHTIGIRLNGKERTDVEEYCISEGWVKVAAPKALDRRGQPILIKLKGTVEAFYK